VRQWFFGTIAASLVCRQCTYSVNYDSYPIMGIVVTILFAILAYNVVSLVDTLKSYEDGL